MTNQTLFGKPVQSVKGDGDKEDFLSYRLHPRVDPRIFNGLNELEQAMIAYISNSQAVYSDGRILPHALKYEVGGDPGAYKNDPLAEMALDYIRLNPPKDMPTAPNDNKIETNLNYNKIVDRSAVFPSLPFKVFTFYNDMRNLVNSTLNMALLHMKSIIETDEGEGKRFRYIHPRFIKYSISSTAVPYLEVVLSIARDHPNMFSSSSWTGFEEFADQYDGFGDQHRLILDTLRHLEVLDDPRFNDIKTDNLKALEDLLGDQASDFGDSSKGDPLTSSGDDTLTSIKGIISVLQYLKKISPENYERQISELQNDKGVISGLRTWLKFKDKDLKLWGKNLITLGEMLGVK